MEQAIRLSPRDPWIGHLYYLIGTVYLLQSHTDEAIVWLEKARSHAYPTDPSVSLPPTLSEARPNAPSPNSPKLAG